MARLLLANREMIRIRPTISRRGRSPAAGSPSRWLLVLVLAGACGEPQDIQECVGTLVVTVPLDVTPAKLRVVMSRGDRAEVSTTDECTGMEWLLLQRQPGELIVQDGSFGYTPPPSFDLTITDLGTCAGTETTLVDAKRVEAGRGFGVCDSAEITLPAAR